MSERELLVELVAATKALLGLDNPPAGSPGHIDYGTAVGMVAVAITKSEQALAGPAGTV